MQMAQLGKLDPESARKAVQKPERINSIARQVDELRTRCSSHGFIASEKICRIVFNFIENLPRALWSVEINGFVWP